MKHLSLTFKRRIAWFLIVVLLAQTFVPTQAVALTGGPFQPEVQSFEPIGTSEMVDVSTGGFVYNIPLLEVGGYPINLAYHSGVNMDDEASCMGGLGWNINVGVINRNMRGLPDDFDGDEIEKKFNMKPNATYGGRVGLMFELFGIKAAKGTLKANLGGFFNTYRGVGLEFGVTPGITASAKGGSELTLGLGLTANSSSGMSLSPQIGINFRRQVKKMENGDLGYLNGGLSIGSSVNSRQGMQSLSMGVSMGVSGKGVRTVNATDENGNTITQTKKISGSRSLYGGDATYSFAAPTYSPGSQFSYLNISGSLSASLGPELFGSHTGVSFSGYFSRQELMQKEVISPAYGVMYAHKGKGDAKSVRDFNREKDMPFTENTPNLPLPILTNDLYSAVGQGIAGSYQLKRGDVGVLSDPSVRSFGVGANIGFEIGAGNAYHAGGDIVMNLTNSKSNAWIEDNQATALLQFQSEKPNDLFESAYFKIAGEKSVEDDPTFLSTLGDTKPVRVELDGGAKSNMDVIAKNKWEGASSSFLSAVKRTKREKRNQPISHLTASEAQQFGLEKSIVSFKPNVYGSYVQPQAEATILRVDAIRKPHHISEVTVLRQDGLRYIYGIPAYNNKQEEVGFSVNGTGNCATGLVSYSGTENSTDNNSGIENYYNKTTIPPYAHSYLLTAVVSADYVDRTGDGPTPDDFGTYTEFRYTRIHGSYRWRVPYQKDMANYNEGFKSDNTDNKANYVYGEKEYWLLHSVESKTQLAEFYYSDRSDGVGVEGQNGGMDQSQTLKKLDKIVLFSRPDRRQNQVNAEAVKTVHFTYDYSLATGIPNSLNNSGKLTLKELHFTYGTSNKGKLSPYKFKYVAHTGSEYTYNLKAYNRWGSFQPNNATSTSCNLSGPVSTSDFPYVPQNNRAQQDKYASWQNLNEIQLPSGGKIKIEYEANDYAYVQNRRAMEMVEIAGFGMIPQVLSTSNQLYSGTIPNNVIFFRLPTDQQISANASQSYAESEIKCRYFSDTYGLNIDGQGFLYFKCLVDIGNAGNQFEYVPGYTKIKNVGVLKSNQSGNYDYGFIELKPACKKDKESKNCTDVNPIAKAAWQFARLNLPRIAYGEPDPTGTGLQQIVEALGGIVKQMGHFVDGFNDQMQKNEYGKHVQLDKSWVRLYSPTKKKVGGGVRVKSIRIADQWSDMAGSAYDNYEYGQEYDYNREEIVNGQTLKFSSGVASYEPFVGGDENPFKQPIFYKEALLLAPDNNHFQEEPYGESFFPAPQIVYSQVTVRNLPRPGVTRNATGWIVYKYYTARDFPTKVSTTGVRAVPKKTNPIFKLLKIKQKDYMTAAQGFLVETNDMAGKPMAQYVYDESGVQISGLEYTYKTDAQGLNNEVTVLQPNGKTAVKTIGMEISLVADSREGSSSVKTAGVHLNSDGFLASVFPILSVVPLPAFQSEKLRFRSMVTTKVIHRYGLLQSTTAYDLGSRVSTVNMVWDSETGEVVQTKTFNEHDDPIYNLNFPAHWAYKGMQAAYQNLGARFSGNITGGSFTYAGASNVFMPGDELSITGITGRGWVKDVAGNSIYIIDEKGSPITTQGSCTLKIIRSGFRNQQLSSVGSVTSLKDPLSGNSLDFQNKQVLNASAIQYDDKWQTWCGEANMADSCVCTVNPAASEILPILNIILNTSTKYIIPKSSLYSIANKINALKPIIDGKCGQTGINDYLFATELVGNDLVCYLGKPGAAPATCWFPCITIKDFAIVVNNPIKVLVFNFFDLKADTGACMDDKFCFKASVETLIDQRGNPYSAWKGETFTFCGTACFDVFKCQKFQTQDKCGDYLVGDVVNPFVQNLRGAYRPKKTWTYLTNRVQSPASASTATNIRTDGYFTQFASFWSPAAPAWTPQSKDWTWSLEATRFNPVGNELENVDTLGRYSAELTGYANTQVTAVTQNARYRQVAFEGFEDYNYAPGKLCSRHFGFDLKSGLTSEASHSGKYSVVVQSNASLATKYKIALPNCNPLPQKQAFASYQLDECDCVGRFSPDPGKYVLSGWVREDVTPGAINYKNAAIQVKVGGLLYGFKGSGQIIDGWQRVYGEFDISPTATDIEVVLVGKNTKAWFDDLRIHPFDASFKSFVYDDITLRFTYELDENNYFTKYEYDQQGMLERVKKETERGVMTIQESRFGQQKQ